MADKCDECMFHKQCSQSHPYGSTYAIEYWTECLNEDATEEEIIKALQTNNPCSQFEPAPDDPRCGDDYFPKD